MAADNPDVPSPTSSYSSGYRRLADFMAWSPTAAIFERFKAANALNLLGLQAEIARLQEELRKATFSDETQHEYPIRKKYQYDWSALQDGEDGDSRQRQLILKMRAALQEYNTALVHQITIENQPSPTQSDLQYLCSFLESPYGLASGLRGPGERLWHTQDEHGRYLVEEKVALWQRSGSSDQFTDYIFKTLGKLSWLMPVFRLRGKRFPASSAFYPNPPIEQDFEIFGSVNGIVSASDNLVTAISSLLITVPIVVLSFVKNSHLRLGLIVLFALIFAFALAFASNASRKDIFSTVAAFVAVQVVFVGVSKEG